jgi:multicomponent Na+:H+ antiporter subunit B
MAPSLRRWVFLAGAGGLVAFYPWGLLGLPGFGNYPGPYGFVLNRIAVSQTKATGVVSAVNFDYRGFDTLGGGVHLAHRRRGGEHRAATAAGRA